MKEGMEEGRKEVGKEKGTEGKGKEQKVLSGQEKSGLNGKLKFQVYSSINWLTKAAQVIGKITNP